MSRSIEELLEAKKNIENELNEALASQRKKILEEVRKLVKLHNLTAKDLGLGGEAVTTKVSNPKPKSEGPKVKRGIYTNPATGQEFDYSKGRPPGWLVELVAGKQS